jgi:predicted metal-dependent peptidase
MNDTERRLISASLLRLRMKLPFFATLALFAKFVSSRQIETAATDGKDILYNPDFLNSLPSAQQDSLLLHEILHAALMHVLRRGVRNFEIWNIACDIVVNGIIVRQRVFQLPPGGLYNSELEHLSCEEIYELLLKENPKKLSLSNLDLLSKPPVNSESEDGERFSSNSSSSNGEPQQLDCLSEANKVSLEAHWRNALQQAAIITRAVDAGKLPAGMDRELGLLTESQLDWRAYLWRYLVQTPNDFMGFDRRFIGRGLYLETLIGESVHAFVAVDTSGSIDDRQLQMFLTEVQGILNAYPHLKCELYYADAEAYGPYPVEPNSKLPSPQGGGGTSFIPFFDKVQESWDGQAQGVCIYLTDGYGTFPQQPPALPVLWVVAPGGLDLSEFLFGEAVRLLSV